MQHAYQTWLSSHGSCCEVAQAPTAPATRVQQLLDVWPADKSAVNKLINTELYTLCADCHTNLHAQYRVQS